jgi:hypothetical protein
MAPQEVAGLQALAKAHGGSLTVNPDTGLAEAGFLSSILPMVAGAALTATGVGAPMAAMMVGGGMTLATGSLQKGLVAGLGAYGGAGLASGLMGAGAAGAAGASPLAGMELAALENPAMAGFEAANATTMSPLSGMESAALENPAVAGFGNIGAGAPAAAVNPIQPLPSPVATVTQAPPTFSSRLSQMGQGFQNLGSDAGQSAFMDKVGGGSGLLKYGLMGLAPAMLQEPKRQTAPVDDATPRYSYAPGRVEDPQAEYTGAYTGQRTYFNPVYTRTAAGGGLMDIGPIEAMSDRNQAETMMSNGGMRFAEGGETKAVKPVEQDPYYTMSGQSGDAFKYLMGQMPAPSRAPAPAPAAVAPVQSTVQAAPAPAKTGLSGLSGRLFAGLGQTPSSEDQGAGGYYEDDTSGLLKSYTFDPETGLHTAVAPKKVFRPYAAPATTTNVPWDGGGTAANGGLMSLAQGGVSHLGDYSDGGRLLRGPGDGVSDDIPATIGEKRPARLADGEFVVPARIVSELGNGSTEAGARKLYAMMDRVQNARKKSIGKNRVAVNSRSEKLLPA